MTAKEKAHQIYDNMYNVESDNIHNMKKEDAIQCALIAVAEIMKAIPDASDDGSLYNHELVWWQEVEREIENL
jgi:hypothetical protein